MTDTTTYGLIYKTTNLINGKIYIGQTVKINKYLSGKYYGSGIYLNRAIKQIGIMNFKTEIVCYAQNKQELDELEIKYIAEYQSYNPLGYNISKGGEGGNTLEFMSQEAKKCRGIKISQNNKGRKLTEQTKQKLREKVITNETRLKFSNIAKNRVYSNDVRQKMSESRKGRKHSDETKTKMRNCNRNMDYLKDRIGKKQSDETIEKRRQTLLGRSRPIEVRNKIRASQIGKKATVEAKNKMSASALNRKKIKCPHCNIEMQINIVKRYHFDNCKKLNQSGGKISLKTVLQNIILSSPYEADKLYLKV